MASAQPLSRTPEQTATDLLGMLLGTDLASAIKTAILTSEYAGLLEVLPALGSDHARKLHQPAFEAACTEGRFDIATVLLKSECVDKGASDSTTDALLGAVANSNVAIVRLLVAETDVDVNVRHVSNDHISPLYEAVMNGDAHCVEALLECDRIDVNLQDIELDYHCALVAAAAEGHLSCLRALLGADNIDVNDENIESESYQCAVVAAARKGDVSCLRALLDADNIDVNKLSYGRVRTSALGLAATNGNLDCVNAFLNAEGIDVNCVREDYDVLEDGSHPLIEAAFHDQLACLNALLAVDGIDVNAVDFNGNTALCCAAQLSVDCTQALLKATGVDINLANDYGKTPLHAAVEGNILANVQALLACKGIDANPIISKKKIVGAKLYPASGPTPLHLASLRGKAEMTQALLISGGCRFKQTNDADYLKQGTAGDGSPLGVTNSDDVRKLFHSGIDYWQRRLHAHHSWAMKQVVLVLLLIEQRLDARTAAMAVTAQGHAPLLPRLPVEIWTTMLYFLRSADFGPLQPIL